jgi:hypothetical protein
VFEQGIHSLNLSFATDSINGRPLSAHREGGVAPI